MVFNGFLFVLCKVFKGFQLWCSMALVVLNVIYWLLLEFEWLLDGVLMAFRGV